MTSPDEVDSRTEALSLVALVLFGAADDALVAAGGGAGVLGAAGDDALVVSDFVVADGFAAGPDMIGMVRELLTGIAAPEREEDGVGAPVSAEVEAAGVDVVGTEGDGVLGAAAWAAAASFSLKCGATMMACSRTNCLVCCCCDEFLMDWGCGDDFLICVVVAEDAATTRSFTFEGIGVCRSKP